LERKKFWRIQNNTAKHFVLKKSWVILKISLAIFWLSPGWLQPNFGAEFVVSPGWR
jgi:hypothetical protein